MDTGRRFWRCWFADLKKLAISFHFHGRFCLAWLKTSFSDWAIGTQSFPFIPAKYSMYTKKPCPWDRYHYLSWFSVEPSVLSIVPRVHTLICTRLDMPVLGNYIYGFIALKWAHVRYYFIFSLILMGLTTKVYLSWIRLSKGHLAVFSSNQLQNVSSVFGLRRFWLLYADIYNINSAVAACCTCLLFLYPSCVEGGGDQRGGIRLANQGAPWLLLWCDDSR